MRCSFCIGYSHCHFPANYCWHWVRNQQTGFFRKRFQWRHSTCCIPFRGMVNKNCDCFCCPWWYCRESSVRTAWGFALISAEVLICIVKFRKCLGPCVASMTTLLFLKKCNTMIGPVSFFIKTNFSENVLSAKSNSTVVVANGFSNWLFVSCILKMGGSLIWKMLFGGLLFYCVQLFLSSCTDISSWIDQSIYC